MKHLMESISSGMLRTSMISGSRSQSELISAVCIYSEKAEGIVLSMFLYLSALVITLDRLEID